MILTQKKCSKCGEIKPLEEFNKNPRSSDGKAYQCRECANAACRQWYAANPEKGRELSRRWQKVNLERKRENARKWAAANPERCRENNRKWNANNADKARENKRKWTAANLGKKRDGQRRTYYKHRDENYANLVKLFGSACLDCEREYPMQIYDYHHTGSTTKTGLLVIGWSWKRVEAYVRGCVQLCPTCHRMRHFLTREKRRNDRGAV